jgi:hypothetical protein
MRRIVLPLVLALTGVFLSYFVMAPGMMSNDSINQYEQAVHGKYFDHHPPIISVLWRQLLFIEHNQLPIFFMHCLLFWMGLFLIGISFSGSFMPIALIAVGFLPHIFVQLGMIWKDVSVVSFFLFFIGLALYFKKQIKINQLALSCIVLITLWIGVAARHNAIFAAVPLLFFILEPSQAIYKKLYKAALITSSFLILQFLVNQYFFKVKTVYPSGQIYLFDTVAIASRTNDFSVIPDYVSSSLHVSKSEIIKSYTPTSGAGILFYGGKSMLPIHYEWYQEAKTFWLEAISRYPLIYIQHRYEVFLSVIGWNVRPVFYPWHRVVDPNPYGLVASDRTITKMYFAFMETLRTGYVLRVWCYLMIACFILLILVFHKKDFSQQDVLKLQVTAALCISALCYTGAYFFIAPVSDLRFNYWTIDAISISLLLFLSVYVPLLVKKTQKLLPEILNKS